MSLSCYPVYTKNHMSSGQVSALTSAHTWEKLSGSLPVSLSWRVPDTPHMCMEKTRTFSTVPSLAYEQWAYPGCSLRAPLTRRCRSCCPDFVYFPHCWTDSTAALDTPSHVSPSPSSPCHQVEPASPGVARCTGQSRDGTSVEDPPAGSCSTSGSLKWEWQHRWRFSISKDVRGHIYFQKPFIAPVE